MEHQHIEFGGIWASGILTGMQKWGISSFGTGFMRMSLPIKILSLLAVDIFTLSPVSLLAVSILQKKFRKSSSEGSVIN